MKKFRDIRRLKVWGLLSDNGFIPIRYTSQGVSYSVGAALQRPNNIDIVSIEPQSKGEWLIVISPHYLPFRIRSNYRLMSQWVKSKDLYSACLDIINSKAWSPTYEVNRSDLLLIKTLVKGYTLTITSETFMVKGVIVNIVETENWEESIVNFEPFCKNSIRFNKIHPHSLMTLRYEK